MNMKKLIGCNIITSHNGDIDKNIHIFLEDMEKEFDEFLLNCFISKKTKVLLLEGPNGFKLQLINEASPDIDLEREVYIFSANTRPPKWLREFAA